METLKVMLDVLSLAATRCYCRISWLIVASAFLLSVPALLPFLFLASFLSLILLLPLGFGLLLGFFAWQRLQLDSTPNSDKTDLLHSHDLYGVNDDQIRTVHDGYGRTVNVGDIDDDDSEKSQVNHDEAAGISKLIDWSEKLVGQYHCNEENSSNVSKLSIAGGLEENSQARYRSEQMINGELYKTRNESELENDVMFWYNPLGSVFSTDQFHNPKPRNQSQSFLQKHAGTLMTSIINPCLASAGPDQLKDSISSNMYSTNIRRSYLPRISYVINDVPIPFTAKPLELSDQIQSNKSKGAKPLELSEQIQSNKSKGEDDDDEIKTPILEEDVTTTVLAEAPSKKPASLHIPSSGDAEDVCVGSEYGDWSMVLKSFNKSGADDEVMCEFLDKVIQERYGSHNRHSRSPAGSSCSSTFSGFSDTDQMLSSTPSSSSSDSKGNPSPASESNTSLKSSPEKSTEYCRNRSVSRKLSDSTAFNSKNCKGLSSRTRNLSCVRGRPKEGEAASNGASSTAKGKEIALDQDLLRVEQSPISPSTSSSSLLRKAKPIPLSTSKQRHYGRLRSNLNGTDENGSISGSPPPGKSARCSKLQSSFGSDCNGTIRRDSRVNSVCKQGEIGVPVKNSRIEETMPMSNELGRNSRVKCANKSMQDSVAKLGSDKIACSKFRKDTNVSSMTSGSHDNRSPNFARQSRANGRHSRVNCLNNSMEGQGTQEVSHEEMKTKDRCRTHCMSKDVPNVGNGHRYVKEWSAATGRLIRCTAASAPSTMRCSQSSAPSGRSSTSSIASGSLTTPKIIDNTNVSVLEDSTDANYVKSPESISYPTIKQVNMNEHSRLLQEGARERAVESSSQPNAMCSQSASSSASSCQLSELEEVWWRVIHGTQNKLQKPQKQERQLHFAQDFDGLLEPLQILAFWRRMEQAHLSNLCIENS